MPRKLCRLFFDDLFRIRLAVAESDVVQPAPALPLFGEMDGLRAELLHGHKGLQRHAHRRQVRRRARRPVEQWLPHLVAFVCVLPQLQLLGVLGTLPRRQGRLTRCWRRHSFLHRQLAADAQESIPVRHPVRHLVLCAKSLGDLVIFEGCPGANVAAQFKDCHAFILQRCDRFEVQIVGIFAERVLELRANRVNAYETDSHRAWDEDIREKAKPIVDHERRGKDETSEQELAQVHVRKGRRRSDGVVDHPVDPGCLDVHCPDIRREALTDAPRHAHVRHELQPHLEQDRGRLPHVWRLVDKGTSCRVNSVSHQIVRQPRAASSDVPIVPGGNELVDCFELLARNEAAQTDPLKVELAPVILVDRLRHAVEPGVAKTDVYPHRHPESDGPSDEIHPPNARAYVVTVLELGALVRRHSRLAPCADCSPATHAHA
mmetsp:Transcript_109093/g.307535  ORF Transcript_109093/g.307535 Transcript_109093/m.307535 type:complete len:432 (+) Transcript_109093:587-1882(+)